MSEEFKIDEECINFLAEQGRDLINMVNRKIEEMINPAEDIFKRYISFNKIKALVQSVEFISYLQKSAMISGNNFNHPFLQTEESKKNNWHTQKLNEDPFFVNPQPENMPDILSILKSGLEKIIKNDPSNEEIVH